MLLSLGRVSHVHKIELRLQELSLYFLPLRSKVCQLFCKQLFLSQFYEFDFLRCGGSSFAAQDSESGTIKNCINSHFCLLLIFFFTYKHVAGQQTETQLACNHSSNFFFFKSRLQTERTLNQ